MNKSGVLILGGAGLLGVMYIYFKKQASKPTLGIPSPANIPQAAARVDNQSQPWYNGLTSWMKSPAQGYPTNPTVAALGDGQSVIHSLKDVWGTASGWFGGDSSSTAPNVDENIFETGQLSNASDQQSNIFGSMDWSEYQDEPITDSGDSKWEPDPNNTDSMGYDNVV